MTGEGRRESLLIGATGIFLCIETLVLLHQMRIFRLPLTDKQEREAIGMVGEVIEKKNSLKDRGLSSLTWYPLAKGDGVRLNDSLMTGPRSSARIRMLSEGEIELGPDTLISLSIERSFQKGRVVNLEINQGTVRIKSRKTPMAIRVKEQKLQLTSESEVVVSEKPMEPKSNIKVEKGTLEVIDPKQEKATAVLTLHQGETLQVAPSREVTKIQTRLELRAKFPSPGERIVAGETQEKIVFQWEGVSAESVEVDGESNFFSPLKFKSDGNKARGELPSGMYYWRIVQGELVSSPAQFTLMPRLPYHPIHPPSGAVLKFGTALRVEWEGVEEVDRYELQIGRSAEFKELVKSATLSDRSCDIGQLDPGVYFWRLRAEHKDLGPWPFSNAYTFRIKKALAAPKPKGVKQLPKRSETLRRPFSVTFFLLNLWTASAWAADDAEKLSFHFDWEPIGGAVGYQLEISADKNFHQTLLSLESSLPSATVELPYLPKYFWRVAAKDAWGDLGEFSPPQVASPLPVVAEVQKVFEKKEAEPLQRESFLHSWKKTHLIPRTQQWGAQWGIRAGVTSLYHYQNVEGRDFRIENRGIPWNRFMLQGDSQPNHFEFQAVYQPQKFRSKNDTLADIQPGFTHHYVSVECIWKSPLYYWQTHLDLGFRLSRYADFVREGPETISVRAVPVFEFLLGPSFIHFLGRRSFLKSEALVELAPLGQVRGVGLLGRASLGFRRLLWGLHPLFFVSINPSVRTISPTSKRNYSVLFSVGILLGWEFLES